MIGLGLLAMKWNLLISKTIFELDLIQLLLKAKFSGDCYGPWASCSSPLFFSTFLLLYHFHKTEIEYKSLRKQILAYFSNVKSMFIWTGYGDFFVYNCQINSRYQWDLNEKLKMAASERQKIENNIVLFCVVTLWEKMTWKNGRTSRKHRLGSR